MPTDQAATALVVVTFLLVLATVVLAILAALQYVTLQRQANDQREATRVLDKQATALAATAASNAAMVDEMVQARIASNPLVLEITLLDAGPGMFRAMVATASGHAAILTRMEFYVGKGGDIGPKAVLTSTEGSSIYLSSGQWTTVDVAFATAPFDTTLGDLLVFRVSGRPPNGPAQTREFLYRIKDDWTLEDVS